MTTPTVSSSRSQLNNRKGRAIMKLRKQRRRVLGGAAAIAFTTVAVLALSTLPAGACPSSPLSLAAKVCDSSVALTWTAPTTGNATGYVIWRSTTSSTPWNATSVPLDLATVPSGWTMIVTQSDKWTGTIFTDTKLANGTTYYYEVAGYDSGGIGFESNLVSAKPATGECGGPLPAGAIGAIPVALLLGGVLVYQQHRRRVRRETTAVAS